MHWNDLKQGFELEFDYLNRLQIDIRDTEGKENIPSLLIQSAGVILKLFDNEEIDKLLLWFPNRKEVAGWLSFISTLGVMKNDYKRNFALKTNFTKGQKLLISDCIVEYIGEDYKEGIGNTITVKYRDNKKDVFGKISYIEDNSPWKEKSLFQPINTSKDVSNANKFYEAIESLRRKKHQLDIVLDIKSNGNRNYFDHNLILVSQIGDTEDFINNKRINGTKFSDLFLWGKLNDEGSISPISSHKIDAKPSCLVSSDFYGAINYLSKNDKKTKGIIIDGTAKCMDNLQALDDILKFKIKKIVVSDLSDTSNLKALTDRDFKMWQWNERWINQNITFTSPIKQSNFYSFTNSLLLFSNTKIQTEISKNIKLEKIIDRMISIGKNLLEGNHEIDSMKIELISIVNEITRLIRIPNELWLSDLKTKVGSINKKYEIHKQWINQKDSAQLSELITSLKEFALNPFTGTEDKVAILYQYINNIINKKPGNPSKLIVVVPKTKDADETQLYWNKLLGEDYSEMIIFTSYDSFFKIKDTSANDQVIVCGWLNSDKIGRLLSSFLSNNYVFLLYPQEYAWFTSAQNKKKKIYEFTIKAGTFTGLLKHTEDELAFINYSPNYSDTPSLQDNFDIDDFELKIKKYHYSKFIDNNYDNEEKIRAKLVIFSQNKFSFISPTHKVYVITDFLMGNKEKKEIKPTLVEDLHENDYVLFRETGRDIIRDISDMALKKAGKDNILELSDLWKKVLRQHYANHFNIFQDFMALLRNAGCIKHPTTVRQWLFDENIIGPHDELDLDIIAVALKEEIFRNKLSEVKNAIKEVRSAHLQAAEYLQKNLLESLPKLLDNKEKLQNLLNGEEQVLNIEGVGQAKLLKVDEVTIDWTNVSIRQVNRLITKEGN